MKIYSALIAGLILISCSKIEEKVNDTITIATQTVKEKAEATVKETISKTVNETVNSVTNSENVPFEVIFPDANPTLISNYSGRKIKLPNGSEAYILKYQSDKNTLLSDMARQSTTDEAKSDKEATKIDGKKFINQLTFLKNFLPDGVLDTESVDEITKDESVEFYQIRRYPKKSTIVINPKNKTIYHFVMVS